MIRKTEEKKKTTKKEDRTVVLAQQTVLPKSGTFMMLMNVSPKYDLHQHLTNQHTQTRPTFIATYFRQFIGTYESSGHLAKGDQQW